MTGDAEETAAVQTGRVLDSLPILVTVHAADGEGTYLDVFTDRQVKSTESPTELIGERLGDVLNDDATERLLMAIETTVRSDTIQYTEFPVEFGGERFWRGAYLAPVTESAGTPAVVIASYDLTRTKERLRLLYDVLEVLVEHTSRTALEEAFCERLVDRPHHALAWLGTLDADGSVRVRATAGTETYLTDLREECGGLGSSDDPGVRAVRTRTRRTATPTGTSDWASVATDHGLRAALAFPLSHGGVDHGVLAVYVAEGEYLADWREDVLATYADGIGYALSAAMWRWALTAEAVAVVEATVSDGLPLSSVCDRADIDAMRVDGVVPRAGETVYYLSVSGGSADSLQRATADRADMRVVEAAGRKPAVAVTSETPEHTLINHGVRFERFRVTPQETTISAAVADAETVRRTVETITSAYSGATIAVRWDTPRDATVDPLDVNVESTLTDRQYEVIQTAYRHGYFGRDREVTLAELADVLDLSRWTVSEHLRVAEQRLLSRLLD